MAMHFNVCLLMCLFINVCLCLCFVSNDFHDGVNDLNVSANESIFSTFVCRVTHMNI